MDDEKIKLQIEKDKALFLIIMGIFFVVMGIAELVFFIELIKIWY